MFPQSTQPVVRPPRTRTDLWTALDLLQSRLLTIVFALRRTSLSATCQTFTLHYGQQLLWTAYGLFSQGAQVRFVKGHWMKIHLPQTLKKACTLTKKCSLSEYSINWKCSCLSISIAVLSCFHDRLVCDLFKKTSTCVNVLLFCEWTDKKDVVH